MISSPEMRVTPLTCQGESVIKSNRLVDFVTRQVWEGENYLRYGLGASHSERNKCFSIAQGVRLWNTIRLEILRCYKPFSIKIEKLRRLAQGCKFTQQILPKGNATSIHRDKIKQNLIHGIWAMILIFRGSPEIWSGCFLFIGNKCFSIAQGDHLWREAIPTN